MRYLKLPLGMSDFEEIRQNGYYYIDKSGRCEIFSVNLDLL